MVCPVETLRKMGRLIDEGILQKQREAIFIILNKKKVGMRTLWSLGKLKL